TWLSARASIVSLLLRGRPPPASFPYTTLFRSPRAPARRRRRGTAWRRRASHSRTRCRAGAAPRGRAAAGRCSASTAPRSARARRSEEHTSELQSRENLVCRLLLEKKKNNRELR